MVDGADPPPHPLNWRGIVVDPKGRNAVEVAYWAPAELPRNCICALPVPKIVSVQVLPLMVCVQVQPLAGVGKSHVVLKTAQVPVNPDATIWNFGPQPAG